jgi:hypothetical protein
MKSSEVAIASPCHEDWGAMTPEGARRFCDRCDKHVHDLSALTEVQARALLTRPAERDAGICVRYRANAAGEIVFAPPTNVVPIGALRRRRVAAALPAAAGLAMALAACTPHDNPDARPTPTIGDREVVGEPIARPEIPDAPEVPMMGAVAVDPEPPAPVVKMGEPMPADLQPDADEPPDADAPCDSPPTPETKPSPEPKPERPMVKMGKVAPRASLESLGEAH